MLPFRVRLINDYAPLSIAEQKSLSIHAPALRVRNVKSQSLDKVNIRVRRGSMFRDALASIDWTMLQHCLSPSWRVLMELHSELKLSNIASLKKAETQQIHKELWQRQ